MNTEHSCVLGKMTGGEDERALPPIKGNYGSPAADSQFVATGAGSATEARVV